MIRPEEAWQRIADTLEPLPAESVPRLAATGRVLAESLTATGGSPAAIVPITGSRWSDWSSP